MLDDDEPKIYGLDKIDTSDPVYITEGPFDSTFIRNAIAMCGLIVMCLMSALMIPFGFLITNLVMSRSQEEYKEVLKMEVRLLSGQ